MDYISRMMVWTGNRFLVLLLGLWVALAPALYAVPAAAMTAQISMSDDGASGGCDDCPEGDMERGLCALMCLNAVQFATTTEPGKLHGKFGSDHEPRHHPALLGRLSTPDPAPPKPVSLL